MATTNTAGAAQVLLSIVDKTIDVHAYQELHWEGPFEDYLTILLESPRAIRNAFQRGYDMILSYGVEDYSEHRRSMQRFRFFRDPMGNGRDAIFGLEHSLMDFVHCLKSAAHGYGSDRRIILLHGPVGSSKSTVVRLLKKGLEAYSRSREGACYTFEWVLEEEVSECPMREEPLRLVPAEARETIVRELNKKKACEYELRVDGDLCPFCRRTANELLKRYKGDWHQMIKHVRVKRLLLSEKDRVGIGTFQPKDEKNQDSTELTGDINYRKIAQYGSDSDPRAFNFDGEFNIANRGLIEFIEVLKLDVAFLYDLLGASQEYVVKPKKFAQTDIDEVIIGHTNEPEYKRLQNNELMEAFRDRTLKIDVPYNLKLDNEIKIYERDYNKEKVKGKHIAPHTVEICSMWAVLSRLEEPKKANLTLLQKLKLYNGKTLPGFTEDNIKELMEEGVREGME
ncbi:MAG: serine protein kinase, partial [Planctomycetes bacterium]|nr:serine protein kinase [Planctomycetota bacterium]